MITADAKKVIDNLPHTDDNKVIVDFRNLDEIRFIIDNYQGRAGMGQSMEDETQYIYVYKDYVLVRTYQKNHWVRENIYWYNGSLEESYDGRWSDTDFK